MDLWLIILIIVVIVVIGAFILLYNGLQQKRLRIDEAWAQIEVQLKRRHDLIPNLVESVKGYAAHERGTFEAVTAARTAAVAERLRGGAPLPRPDLLPRWNTAGLCLR